MTIRRLHPMAAGMAIAEAASMLQHLSAFEALTRVHAEIDAARRLRTAEDDFIRLAGAMGFSVSREQETPR